MWRKQSNTLIVCNAGSLSIQFPCPICGTSNTVDLSLPKFSNNYDRHSDADVTEDNEIACSKCGHSLEISVTNGPGGCLVQVEGIKDSDIELDC